MAVHQSVSGQAHILTCTGEIALGKNDEVLMRACQEAIEKGATWIILDLTAVSYLDSAGVGAIVSCSKRAADSGAVIRLVVASGGPVRKVLTVTHLDRAFDLYSSVNKAVEEIPRGR